MPSGWAWRSWRGCWQHSRGARRRGRRAPSFAKWRLRRAVEYIDAHLGEPVSLADIASAAGLSRMHFAAQFKSATGLRPHEFLLRRRIERAQEELLSDGASVVDVALSVGFQSQPHFTTIFRRIVGQPPHAWRRSNGFGGFAADAVAGLAG